MPPGPPGPAPGAPGMPPGEPPGPAPGAPGVPSGAGRPPGHRAGPPPGGTRPPGTDLARPGDLPPLELDLSDEGRTGRSREERRAVAAEAKRSRAGRNLPAAIGVGVLLAGVVLGSLFLWRPAFVGVLAVCAGVGVWEMVGALSRPAPDGSPARAHPPLVPLLGGCVVMQFLAWYGGISSLVLGLLITVLAAVIWRLSTDPRGFHRDITAATMIAVYVPFLLGFGVLLAMPDDGQMRVLTVLALVVLSDTGGYAAGVFLGKHPMAPSVSPKKSWEGLAGSLVAAATGGALLVEFVFHDPWWHGAILGLAVSAAAVVGDLAESLLKRDLKIKDMSNLLPGHGGLMDRLDSVVFAAPTAFMVMALLVPV
ncbi:MAG TPA: phosphatidate cytidylyltransferase [Micromonosporaceae bacterium]|nr:phosphatidate cytidylyltransferase [Micromonosporaceae bacterium]